MKNSFRVGFVNPGYENLSIEYLSANLKSEGFETRLFLDPILFSEGGFLRNRFLSKVFSYRESVIRKILEYEPGLVAFSVISDNFRWARDLSRKIKEHIDVPIVWGGIHPSSVPEQVIACSEVDYVCIGEGDFALVELVKVLSKGASAHNIKNIYSKQKKEIFRNPSRPLVKNLDSLPFPDKDLFYESFPIFGRGYIISTSRGCPYSCNYCCNNVWKQIYSFEKKY